MPSEAILAIDQGTTNTKALLVGRDGRAFFKHSVPVTLLTPRPGFVEQDPVELWQSVLTCIRACVRHAEAVDATIKGIAISNQRETALAWKRGPTPHPLSNAISWQCRRSTAICERLSPHTAEIQSISGLPIDPLNSAGKWAWLIEHDPALRAGLDRGDVLLGNVDSWLLANLTAGVAHATDHTNASRSGVYDLQASQWNPSLLALYGMFAAGLPAIQPSASHFGVCSALPELRNVPIVAMIGDSHAALVGHGRSQPGSVKATYGTGSSLMMLADTIPAPSMELARTVAWSDAQGVRFALEGNIAMTGSAVQWVGEFLGLTNPTDDTISLAATVPDAAGVRFVPAMVGLGAPHWNTNALGLICNLGRSHRAAHLARAAVDAIAFQVADVLASMERTSSTPVPHLLTDGGATRNEGLMQFQADIIGRPVLRSANEELSAIGAAWLGGLTLGWWPSAAAFEHLAPTPARYDPAMSAAERNTLQQSWQTAVKRSCLETTESPA